MQAARTATRTRSLLVTFSTLDGQTLSGRMASFDPRAPDHRVELFARGPEEPAALRVLPVERVAWVGMHRDPEAPQRAPEDAQVWRVRFLKGGGLKVLASRGAGAGGGLLRAADGARQRVRSGLCLPPRGALAGA
jgi:hypothetical protein